MIVTISRLYNTHDEAKEAVRTLEVAGVSHHHISLIAGNADRWYSSDPIALSPDRGVVPRVEGGAGVDAAVGGAAGFLRIGFNGNPGRRARLRDGMAGGHAYRGRSVWRGRRSCWRPQRRWRAESVVNQEAE